MLWITQFVPQNLANAKYDVSQLVEIANISRVSKNLSTLNIMVIIIPKKRQELPPRCL
jgi:hypothetical protein